MSLKKEISRQAVRLIGARAQNARLTAAAHEAEIRETLPEVYRLRRELSETASEVGKAIFSSTGDVKARIAELQSRNQAVQQQIAELLQQNGYPADYLSCHYTCAACRDTGFVDGEKCVCLKKLECRLMADALHESAAFDGGFDSFSLDYYPDDSSGAHPSARETMRRILNFCKSYADGFGNASGSILLLGGTGLGKTHLSLSIANRVIEKGYAVLYGTAQDFLRRIEDEHFGRVPTQTRTLDELLEAELLILDDLGAEFYSEFYVATVYNLINTRLNRRLPTILSTNLNAAELEQRYSARIVSRVFSDYTCLRCVGNDVRILKARKTD